MLPVNNVQIYSQNYLTINTMYNNVVLKFVVNITLFMTWNLPNLPFVIFQYNLELSVFFSLHAASDVLRSISNKMIYSSEKRKCLDKNYFCLCLFFILSICYYLLHSLSGRTHQQENKINLFLIFLENLLLVWT